MTGKNGKFRTGKYWKDFGKESGGLGIAEFASSIVSLGVVAVTDDLAPNLMQSASKVLSKTCIEPYLDPIERFLKKTCRLKECQPDMTQPREKRAEALAHTTILFSASWVASMITKMVIRKLCNDKFHVNHPEEPRTEGWWHDNIIFRKITRHDLKVLVYDEGVHLGSLVLLNTSLAKYNDSMIRSVSGMLQKTLGWTEQRAKNTASLAVIWELPNLLGLISGSAAIGHTQYKYAKRDKAKWLLGGGDHPGHPAP